MNHTTTTDATQADATEQPVEGVDYEDIIAALPAGHVPFDDLLLDFSRSLPPGAPPQADALMRRVFVSGAMAVMGQIHMAFMSERTKAGDPADVVAVVNAMGAGVQVAAATCEQEAAALAQRAPKGGIIIPIHAEH